MRLLSKASLFAMILTVVGCSTASANDVYIAQTARGGNSGADCADAKVYTYFNAAGNWTSGTPTGTQIGPGTTVHLCGTFNMSAGASCSLTFQSGGSNGSPVTLKFETGAVATATYWGANGFICGNGQSYITVDGGANGTIQATANGSSLANQKAGSGMNMDNCANSEVKNLTLSNLYVAVNGAEANNIDVYGIHWLYGSNNSIDNNTLHDCRWCIYFGYHASATTSNISIFSNTVYNCDHGIAIGDGGNGAVLSGTNTVYGNTIHDFVMWDEAADNDHHDGIHIWAVNGSSSTISDIQIYNNYLYGDVGIHDTAYLFIDAENGGTITSEIFNNLVVNTSSTDFPADAMIFVEAVNNSLYNNTLVGQVKASGVAVSSYGTGTTVKNNIFSTISTALYSQHGSFTSDYNVFYNIGSPLVWFNPGSQYNTLAAWQASQGNPDAHSTTGNPNLTGTYQLGPGSSGIGAGTNLTYLGIVALDSDKNGVLRPGGSSPWDIGAYQSSGAPAPPTGLTATPQ